MSIFLKKLRVVTYNMFLIKYIEKHVVYYNVVYTESRRSRQNLSWLAEIHRI